MAALADRRPVGGGGSARRRPLRLATVAVAASGDDEARHEALDVPLERRRQRLVEVVEVEHELGDPAPRTRRSSTDAHRRSTARASPSSGCATDRRHDRGAPAVERERRDDHPPVTDRHELGHARRVLLLEDADRVGTVIGRRPLAVRLQRHRLALGAPLGQALLDRLGAPPTPGRVGGGTSPTRGEPAEETSVWTCE